MTLPETGRSRCRVRKHRAPGFTLTELLVTVAVIAILCALVGPALIGAGHKARQTKCLSNQRQLAMASATFSLDNADQLPPNSSLESPVAGTKPPWVSGSSHNRQQHFTNTALLTRPDYAAFSGYLPGPLVYKCPSDRFVMNQPEAKGPKARTYSMNNFVDGAPNAKTPRPTTYEVFSRQSDFARLSPSAAFTFIEVVPENLCYSAFITDMGSDGFFYHLPGRSHSNRGTLAFADGHVESRRWFNPAERGFNARNFWGHFVSYESDMRDHEWLKAHATVLKAR